MFRLLPRLFNVARNTVPTNLHIAPMMQVRMFTRVYQDDKDFDQKMAAYFSRSDVDGWDIRDAMNDISGMDLVPEPEVIDAALRACRRINDYALAIRFLELVKEKCGGHVDKIWPYLLQNIQPTLDELGIDTPEQLGYDKPELFLKSSYTAYESY